jgi:menaquinone-dependent protoporphyrinogen oxidase
MRVLVTYASAHGSTAGIAERIGGDLAARGIDVDCMSVSEVSDVRGYDAFVLGSAIHDQAWLPQAAEFVRTHADVLGKHPVWLFSVGMPGALAPPLRKWAMVEGPKVVQPFDELIHPREARLFSGVVRREQFPFVSRVIFRLLGGRWGDSRNWGEIDQWSAQIVTQLVVATL